MEAGSSEKQKSKKKPDIKKISLILLAFLLIMATTVVGYLVYQETIVTKQKAYTGKISDFDSCKKVKIELLESPSCPKLYQSGNQTCPLPGQTNPVTSYTTTFRITSNDNQNHEIVYKTASEYCDTPCGTWYESYGGNYSCTVPETGIYEQKTAQVATDQPLNITVSRSSPSGQACGTYQQDLWIESIDGQNNCNFKTQDNNVGAWGMCQTGLPCEEQSPSPTPEDQITPSPTLEITPTATPTQTQTPTPTLTPTPTETLTPNPSPTPTGQLTPTPTNAVTSTPTQTPTPTEIILTNNTGTTAPTNPTSQPTIAEAGSIRWLYLIALPLALIIFGLL